MKCIVVDDDPIQREAIRSCINQVSDLELVGMYPNAIEARIALQKRHVDLIFLDVEMPGSNGFDYDEKNETYLRRSFKESKFKVKLYRTPNSFA